MDLSGARRDQSASLGDPDPKPAAGILPVVWALLALNTLGSIGQSVLPLPRPVWQLFTMGALAVAFTLALVINPRIQIRPSVFLLLLSILAIVSIGSSMRLESGVGSVIRCVRLTVFVATLWLLTRWWDDGMTFVRTHIRVLAAVLLTVAVGLVAAPGMALDPAGRLVGVLWPLTPPQVAQYSAIVIGLTLILWLGRRTDGRSVAIFVPPSIGLLFLTHTRTATVGLLVGLTVAALSLMLTSARARRAFTRTALVAGLAAVTFGPAIQVWFRRGQDQESLSNFTGRGKVWDALLAAPRSTSEHLFGVGLTNKSFNGLAIDNSWLAVYQDQGLVGCALVAAFIATLIVAAVLRPPSLARACALFLIVYCLTASFTEAGLGDASPYLLNLVVAAALLSTPWQD
jgi:hypothetical protein